MMDNEKNVKLAQFLRLPHGKSYTAEQKKEEARIKKMIEGNVGGVFHPPMGRTHVYHAETRGLCSHRRGGYF